MSNVSDLKNLLTSSTTNLIELARFGPRDNALFDHGAVSDVLRPGGRVIAGSFALDVYHRYLALRGEARDYAIAANDIDVFCHGYYDTGSGTSNTWVSPDDEHDAVSEIGGRGVQYIVRKLFRDTELSTTELFAAFTLHYFDLDCCRFGMYYSNGDVVLCTTAAGFEAYRTGVNDVDPSCASFVRTYIRAKKYVARGFVTRFAEPARLVFSEGDAYTSTGRGKVVLDYRSLATTVRDRFGWSIAGDEIVDSDEISVDPRNVAEYTRVVVAKLADELNRYDRSAKWAGEAVDQSVPEMRAMRDARRVLRRIEGSVITRVVPVMWGFRDSAVVKRDGDKISVTSRIYREYLGEFYRIVAKLMISGSDYAIRVNVDALDEGTFAAESVALDGEMLEIRSANKFRGDEDYRMMNHHLSHGVYITCNSVVILDEPPCSA